MIARRHKRLAVNRLSIYNSAAWLEEWVSWRGERMFYAAIPWNLTIASDLRLLSLTRAFVEGVCLVAGFDENFIHAVVLATDEATNNVMRHAHQDNPDAAIQIQCRLLPDGIEIRLIDEGEPFDL